jgi:copper(I)-binding protein
MHKLIAAALLIAAATTAQAQPVVRAEGGWVRATVPGQRGTGAFVTLTAPEGATLLRASSPVAGVTEIHEMKLDEGGVMRMRAIPQLALPAGQPVALKPGGHHVMLMDLKAPLPKDVAVPLTLVLRDAQGREQQLELKLPVQAVAPGAHRH